MAKPNEDPVENVLAISQAATLDREAREAATHKALMAALRAIPPARRESAAMAAIKRLEKVEAAKSKFAKLDELSDDELDKLVAE